MPIYEYACDQCGHVFDVLQKMSEDPLKFCPECGADGLRKLLSAPAFRLKGGGWYETDFKTGDKRNLHGEDGKKKDASGDTAGSKADKTDKTDKAAKKSGSNGASKATSSGDTA